MSNSPIYLKSINSDICSQFPAFPTVPAFPQFLSFPQSKNPRVSRLFDADRRHFLKLNNFVVILNANYANFTKIKLAKLAKFESFALKGFAAKEKKRVSERNNCHQSKASSSIVINCLLNPPRLQPPHLLNSLEFHAVQATYSTLCEELLMKTIAFQSNGCE